MFSGTAKTVFHRGPEKYLSVLFLPQGNRSRRMQLFLLAVYARFSLFFRM